MNDFTEVVEITLEQKIETDLVKANVTDAVIGKLKSNYGNLRLASLDDKGGYLEIKDAAKECAKWRNTAVKVCKAGREDAIKVQKLWVAKEKEVVGKILEVETPLDAEIAKFDAEVERKDNEVKWLQEEAYMKRTQELTRMGASYDNGEFSLGNFSMEALLVKESSENIWAEQVFPKFQAEYKIIEAERIEQKRIQDEKDAAIRKEREDFERQQAEFKAQQEAFKKQQEEDQRRKDEETRLQREAEEKKNREIFKHRSGVLSSLGMYFGGDNFYYTNAVLISNEDVISLPENEWVDLITKTTSNITKIKSEAAEKEHARIDAEKKAAEELAAKNEREKIEREQREAEQRRQQEEAKKAEDLLKSGDKANWEALLEHISAITVPPFKSGQYRKVASIVTEKLKEIQNLKPY